MTSYRLNIENAMPAHATLGEPQIDLPFESEGIVYHVTSRTYYESINMSTLHAKIIL